MGNLSRRNHHLRTLMELRKKKRGSKSHQERGMSECPLMGKNETKPFPYMDVSENHGTPQIIHF